MTGTQTVLLAAAALCAGVYLFMPPDPSGPVRALIKTVPVALFAVMAALADAPGLLIVAFVFSAFGDWLLAFASADGSPRADHCFAGGLSAFLIAHIAYAALFLAIAERGLTGPDWFGALAMTGVGLFMGRVLFARAGVLRFPVFCYIVAIMVMGVSALPTGSC